MLCKTAMDGLRMVTVRLFIYIIHGPATTNILLPNEVDVRSTFSDAVVTDLVWR